ncbi:MAG: LysR family transcriptional regulator [Oscillatoria sp. SIO1A7]|nr:LysR family transcriptional regulator [Oscillatoria sp. SIO1A7]
MLKFANEFNYDIPISKKLVVGTLGPSGTSSESVLEYVVEQLQLEAVTITTKLFENFARLKEALLSEKVNLALVPHAYHNINDFYMEPSFELSFIFIYPTPVYGLAKKPIAKFDINNCTILTHPAPLPLLSYLMPDYEKQKHIKVKLVDSTSVAAKEVSDGLAELALTNEKAANKYGLEFIRTYGEIKMSWSIFKHKEDNFSITHN